MDQPRVPEELQEELVIAIQKLCVFIHDAAGMSQVILNVSHVSDALNRSGVTSVSAVVGGCGVTRGDSKPAADPKAAQDMVNDLVNSMMAKAKDKGVKENAPAPETAPETKPEDKPKE